MQNNAFKQKNKNIKKPQDIKNTATTGYGNSKYSKKGNQHIFNNNFNNKKKELNIELPEEDDITNQYNLDVVKYLLLNIFYLISKIIHFCKKISK